MTGREVCPTCGHPRETFQSPEGTGGFVPPMPNQDGGKLARLDVGDDEGIGIRLSNGVLLMPDVWTSSEAEDISEEINTAHQAALTSERKRVLEMAASIAVNVGDAGCRCAADEHQTKCPFMVGKDIATEIRALLSRLEGEGKP